MAKASKATYYLGNPNLPNVHWKGEYTKEMISSIKKAKDNLLYFAENFFYIVDPDKGKVVIPLFPFQRKILRTLRDNRFTILNASRQISKTTLLTIYALWIACFQEDKNILIVANKEATAIEIFRRVRLAYEQLPEWLKPGVKEYGKTSAEFANGSRIGISTTTGSAARGQTINLLLIDEMAFIDPPSILEDFWRSVWPTVSRAKTSKVLIASTPNGTGNLFHRLVSEALAGKNDFVVEELMWDAIPGRDEKWKQDQIKTLGSVDSFRQEYECIFLNTGDTAIDEELFAHYSTMCCSPIPHPDPHFKVFERQRDGAQYIAGVDVSEGVGEDSSIIQLIDISDLTAIKQVAVYRNNKISPLEFTNKCHEIFLEWGSPIALIERNNQGAQVIDRLFNDLNYTNIVNYGAKVAGRTRVLQGMISHTNTKNKAVSNMRHYVNILRAIKFCDIETVREFKKFTRQANGTWKAENGAHDDLVMAFIWALMILEKEITEQYFNILSTDDYGKPLQLENTDFGVGKYISTDSMYSEDEFGINNTIKPILFGMGLDPDADSSEMFELLEQGWTRL